MSGHANGGGWITCDHNADEGPYYGGTIDPCPLNANTIPCQEAETIEGLRAYLHGILWVSVRFEGGGVFDYCPGHAGDVEKWTYELKHDGARVERAGRSGMTSDIPRVERDGLVAVLVSPGFGGGWSTWIHDDELAARAVFDPDIVAWVEAGKTKNGLMLDLERRYKMDHISALGDVEIEWVPKGARFIIDEYDGGETLTIIGPEFGYVA